MSVLKPAETVTVFSPNLNAVKNIVYPVYFYKGYIKIPADGTYHFYLSSDTKAFIRIHEAALIDEDFGYAGGTIKEAVIKLKAGLHPISVYYKTKPSAKYHSLQLEWEGPSVTRQSVPANIFYRAGK